MKKSGFTMIELIFVIVILGVLAAVAIPKLNATRDDAEQAKAMTNLATLMGDLTSYYTAQGTFADKISSMTNVPLTELDSVGSNISLTVNTNAKAYAYEIKNEPCLVFQTAGAALIVAPNTTAKQKVCQNILTNKSSQNIIRGSYTCDTAITTTANGEMPGSAPAAGTNDAKLPDDLKTACKSTNTGNGIPSTIEKNTTYHHTLTTALGQDKTGADAKGVIAKFAPVVMSFEGAGVAF